MTSTTNSSGGKLFHTYENVGYDAEQQPAADNYSCPQAAPVLMTANSNGNGITSTNGNSIAINKSAIELPFADPILHNGKMTPLLISSMRASFSRRLHSFSAPPSNSCPLTHSTDDCGALKLWPDPTTPNITPNPSSGGVPLPTAKVLSTATDSAGVTRMLTSAHTGAPSTSSSTSLSHRLPPSGQNLVTKLVSLPVQSPMDSLKEWSVSTFKCTKQLINEKRGICPITNDSHLQNDIELLRENRNKLVQMLRYAQQMASHYGQLVRTQKQLHALMNEMSIKCFASGCSSSSTSSSGSVGSSSQAASNNHNYSTSSTTKKTPSSKQVVANFSSLGNNLSSSTTTATTSPTHATRQLPPPPAPPQPHVSGNQNFTAELHSFDDFLPVLNHMKSTSNLNLVDDFKRNAITLNAAMKNGEKLLAALNFFSSNLSTLIDKTIEDTLTTVKQYESARLEYDAEKNSLNFFSPTAQTQIIYSSEKLELARMRYEQLKEDIQIKMRLLEENTAKVMHKQLLIFNGAFAAYTSGNTAALDATLRQFSIRDNSSC